MNIAVNTAWTLDDHFDRNLPMNSGSTTGKVATIMTIDRDLPLRVGEAVRRSRVAKGLSQTDLAEIANVQSHAAISRLERGERKTLDVEQLIRIAQALGVTLDFLFSSGVDGDPISTPPADVTEQRQQIIDDVIAMLTDLKSDGILDMSDELFRPYAEAVADRAIRDAATTDVPLQKVIFRKVSNLISKR